jgi:hypothetical protein
VPPKVLHYGLEWEVGDSGYLFDKHWYFQFDALQCPPWNLSEARPSGGLFRHPPHPATYPREVRVSLPLLQILPDAATLTGTACTCLPSRKNAMLSLQAFLPT